MVQCKWGLRSIKTTMCIFFLQTSPVVQETLGAGGGGGGDSVNG